MKVSLMVQEVQLPRDEWLIGATKILNEVLQKRVEQEEKWGPTSYPFFALPHNQQLTPLNVQLHYGVPSASQARKDLELSFKGQYPSYAHILMEELAEAMEETHDPQKLRTELLQVAAVVVAAIEDLDKKLPDIKKEA